MRIHLVKEKTIIEYADNNAQSRSALFNWLEHIQKADCNSPEDFLNRFSSADLLGNGTNRIVFDIGGNRYRIICEYFFGKNLVHLYICWIGTHTHYSKLCAEQRQYTIQHY